MVFNIGNRVAFWVYGLVMFGSGWHGGHGHIRQAGRHGFESIYFKTIVYNESIS